MPRTRHGGDCESPGTEKKKTLKRKNYKPVDRDANMAAENQNANHSNDSVESVKRKIEPVKVAGKKHKLTQVEDRGPMPVMLKSKTRSKPQEPNSTASLQEFNDQVVRNNSEVHEFEEDGEHIQMEINDGGAAAAEFSSDPETDNDSDEESGGSEHDVTVDTEVDMGTENAHWTEQNANTSRQEEMTQNDLLEIERGKR